MILASLSICASMTGVLMRGRIELEEGKDEDHLWFPGSTTMSGSGVTTASYIESPGQVPQVFVMPSSCLYPGSSTHTKPGKSASCGGFWLGNMESVLRGGVPARG